MPFGICITMLIKAVSWKQSLSDQNYEAGTVPAAVPTTTHDIACIKVHELMLVTYH